jgi:hypothetical protein
VNVDTGTFEALCERVDALAAQVTFLEQMLRQRNIAFEALVRAGEESALRKLGLAPAANVRGADSPRPRHLRAVRGDS